MRSNAVGASDDGPSIPSFAKILQLLQSLTFLIMFLGSDPGYVLSDPSGLMLLGAEAGLSP